ncbi:MAG: RNA polymerase sigma factor region1.1 domain-containing protein, partial [Marinobacter sp.]
MSGNSQKSRLKDLIARGKEQGYLTYAEVNDHLPEDIADPDQVEDIIRMINDMGIQVCEETPDADTLLMTEGDSTADEAAAAEAAAALAAVETDAGRTTDPVRMYMREMGTVELLTREGEIVIAKRIEEGIRDVMAAVAHFPGTAGTVIQAYDRIIENEGRISDIVTGFLDPDDAEPFMGEEPVEEAKVDTNEAEDAEDEEEEEKESGPDPEETRLRFELLKEKLEAANEALAKHGRGHKKTQEALNELGAVFAPFKLGNKAFDELVNVVRSTN